MQEINTIAAPLPKLVRDYLDGFHGLNDCYACRPNLEGLKEAWKERVKAITDRSNLIAVLHTQAKASSYTTETTLAQLEKLKDPKTVTVTTGHQLCIYGGPLFFFYKIISAIRLCEQLKTEGIEAVPVYWMASEDHDFEEVNHVFIGDQKIVWDQETSGPVGHLRLDSIHDVHAQVRALFRDDQRYGGTLDELDRIFSPEKTLAGAIRDFVYWVFAEQGVLVIDADHPALKAGFAPVVERELSEKFAMAALNTQNEYLTGLGYPVQVGGREINLFWSEPGYRERIIETPEGFATADHKHQWSKKDLLTLAHKQPEKFSPNVILRPVYQEIILPNIAYVGGPGELSYWLQLKPVFDHIGVPFPAVLLRDMFLLVDEAVVRKMTGLGIGYSDLWRPVDEVFTELLRKSGESHEHLVEEKSKETNLLMAQLIGSLTALDPNLGTSAETEHTRIQKRLEVLRKKVLRNDKRQQAHILQRLEYLHTRLFPHNTPQERVENWLQYHHDPRQLVTALTALADPLRAEVKVVVL